MSDATADWPHGRMHDGDRLLLRGAAGVAFHGEVEIVLVDDPPAGGVAALVVVRSAADEQYRVACERSLLGYGDHRPHRCVFLLESAGPPRAGHDCAPS